MHLYRFPHLYTHPPIGPPIYMHLYTEPPPNMHLYGLPHKHASPYRPSYTHASVYRPTHMHLYRFPHIHASLYRFPQHTSYTDSPHIHASIYWSLHARICIDSPQIHASLYRPSPIYMHLYTDTPPPIQRPPERAEGSRVCPSARPPSGQDLFLEDTSQAEQGAASTLTPGLPLLSFRPGRVYQSLNSVE